jgi:choline dehydrogenase-like flavoprotein
MGAADDDRAVVDPELRVRGIEGLRIADASVFPRILCNNLAMSVMMVGERCAELITAGTLRSAAVRGGA